MSLFDRYADYALLAALALAGVAVMSHFLHWGGGTVMLLVYAASLFGGLAIGLRVFRARLRRQRERQR